MFAFNIIEKVLLFVECVLNVSILYIVLKRFLGFKTKYQYVIIAMLITGNIPFLIVEKLNIESIYQWIPTTLYIFVFSLIFCKGTCLKKIIVTIIYNCFYELFQYITVPLIYMSNYTSSTEHLWSIENHLFLITSQLLYILMINFILKHYSIHNNLKDFKYMLFFVIPNVFIVALLSEYFKLYYRSNNMNNSLFSNIRMIGFASMALICALLTVITLDKLIKENDLRQRELLLTQQLNMQTRHYKDLQIQFKNIRFFKHDINNHLICIKNLIANGDIESTEEYLKRITQSLERLNLKVNTGNPFADAVISEKYNISIHKNIDFKCNAKIPEDIKIDPFDLCVIIGNALDNAIEACEKITDDNIKKYIHITSTLKKSFIVFEIKNSMEGYIDKDHMSTDKGDPINHGLGFLNIESIADKYFGTTYIENSENMFVLNIMLQIL